MADDEMGQANPIARVKKGKLPIPTPGEIVKDKLKELALEHGWDALKWAWQQVKKPITKKKQLPAAKGGGAIVVLALLAATSAKKKRRR